MGRQWQLVTDFIANPFIQAKRSKATHKPCADYPTKFQQDFVGDSTQWYLLNRRPDILGQYATFRPPTDLLSGAILRSVATYCVFHAVGPKAYSFFYASADVVTGMMPSKAGDIPLSASSSNFRMKVGAFDEQKVACCPMIFGAALFEGCIGTPIGSHGVTSPQDGEWRAVVRRWLGSVAAGAPRTARVGAVIRTFINTFDIATDANDSAPPAKSIVFIQGDDLDSQ